MKQAIPTLGPRKQPSISAGIQTKAVAVCITLCALSLLVLAIPETSRADNLFVGDPGVSYIYNVDSSGKVTTFTHNNNRGVGYGLAFNNSGNLYMSSFYDNGSIVKFDEAGVGIVFASGLTQPMDLAFDRSGNLYVANLAGNIITKFDSSGIGTLFATTAFQEPCALAFDSSGDLYVTYVNNSTIEKFSPSGRDLGLFAHTDMFCYDMAFDKSGTLYVCSKYNNTITKFDSLGVGTIFATASSGLDAPYNLAFDSSGDLYVSNFDSKNIMKFNSSGVGTVFMHDVGQILNPTTLAFQPIQVPEPSTWSLLALGAVVLLGGLRLRRRS